MKELPPRIIPSQQLISQMPLFTVRILKKRTFYQRFKKVLEEEFDPM
jgi:hypothetical protein